MEAEEVRADNSAAMADPNKPPIQPKARQSAELVESERREVRRLIELSKMKASNLSEAIGRDKNYLSDFLKDRKKSIAAADFRALEEIARRVQAEGPVHVPAPQPEQYRPPPDFLGARDLPVYAAVEGGPGVMVVSTDPIDMVPRPWFFEHVRDAFVVLVVGESMVPAFDPGDMAMVNPRLPPMRDKDAIFIASKDDGDFRASIKRFVRSSEKEFVVKQFNPPKELRLPRTEWGKVYRVVGKYNGN